MSRSPLSLPWLFPFFFFLLPGPSLRSVPSALSPSSATARLPRRAEEGDVQDLLRHVRNMGTRVERDLDGMRHVEKRLAADSEDDAC